MSALVQLLVGSKPDARATLAGFEVQTRPTWIGWLEAESGRAAGEALGQIESRPVKDTAAALEPLRAPASVGGARPSLRAAAIGASRAQVAEALLDALKSERKLVPSEGLAFLWTGQGAQYPRMATGLESTYPVVKRIMARSEAVLGPMLGRSPRDVLLSEGDEIHETELTQALLFVVEYALASLWEAAGVRPSALLGHSIGEVAAACFAGVLDLEDALRLVASRGRSMQRASRDGAMAAVMLDEASVRARLPRSVALAAVNGPNAVVISGPTEELDALLKAFEKEGVVCQRLRVSHAFHSEAMTPILAEFEDAVRDLVFRAPTLPLLSNVEGRLHPSERVIDAAYFGRHIRSTVRFDDGLRELDRSGVRHFLEIGPRPTLSAMARRSLGRRGRAFVASLSPELEDSTCLMTAGATLFELGYAVDFSVLAGVGSGEAA